MIQIPPRTLDRRKKSGRLEATEPQAFDGEGARRNGGRWNSPGLSAIYTSENISLAVLEIVVHVGVPILRAYRLSPVTFDDSLVEEVAPRSLPRNWRRARAPVSVTAIGDGWLRRGSSAVLRVPSAVVPQDSNYVLNPFHRDFGQISVGSPLDFDVDSRLSAPPGPKRRRAPPGR